MACLPSNASQHAKRKEKEGGMLAIGRSHRGGVLALPDLDGCTPALPDLDGCTGALQDLDGCTGAFHVCGRTSHGWRLSSAHSDGDPWSKEVPSAISPQVMSTPNDLHTRRKGRLPTVVSGAR